MADTYTYNSYKYISFGSGSNPEYQYRWRVSKIIRAEKGYNVSIEMQAKILDTRTSNYPYPSIFYYINGTKVNSSHHTFTPAYTGDWTTIAACADLYSSVSLGAWETGTCTLKINISQDGKEQSGSYNYDVPAYYTYPSAPSISITDNGNNTYRISATAGSDGRNNPASLKV